MSHTPAIVFMGTPEFALAPLAAIKAEGYPILAVVTAPDKQAGRGLKLSSSPVKQFAQDNNIKVLQPEKLNSESFINELRGLLPDLLVVVAFRKIPSSVLAIPKLGAFNLHASLLPQYRGAAPINHAIINGETISGITTFFLNDKIDEGNIIMQEKVDIPAHFNASMLHEAMKESGAALVLRTIIAIQNSSIIPSKQDELLSEGVELNSAPKIFKDDCRINWDLPAVRVHNLIRGLSYSPGAFCSLISPSAEVYHIKILASEIVDNIAREDAGIIETDCRNYLNVHTLQGAVSLKEVQLAGKKRMDISDFLKGFHLTSGWKFK